MKEVLLSTRPKWCKKIASGEKKIEVRKTRPKEVPFKVLIYCTRITDKKHCRDEFDVGIWKGNNHIIGEFICDKVYSIKNQGSRFSVADEEQSVTNEIARQSCLDYDDMVGYLGNKDGYAWHISNLVIYDKPKKLSDFYKLCPTKEECDCGNCERFEQYVCTNYLTRPPESWQYVLDK